MQTPRARAAGTVQSSAGGYGMNLTIEGREHVRSVPPAVPQVTETLSGQIAP